MASTSLEGTIRSLSGLPTEDHEDHWMAQPPHSLAIQRRIRWDRKSRVAPSKLSPANSQPAYLRRKAALGHTGGMRGLSRMWRNPPVRFLGEGKAVTSFPLPDRSGAVTGSARSW